MEKHSKRGLWTEEEDQILLEYVRVHGRGKWNRIPKVTGLTRGGKSCRLRWLNYLCPAVKRGAFSKEEDDLIIRLHKLLGNRWSLIAGRVPRRTDNQVKNHWNTHLCKKIGVKKHDMKMSAIPSLKPQLIHSTEGERLAEFDTLSIPNFESISDQMSPSSNTNVRINEITAKENAIFKVTDEEDAHWMINMLTSTHHCNNVGDLVMGDFLDSYFLETSPQLVLSDCC